MKRFCIVVLICLSLIGTLCLGACNGKTQYTVTFDPNYDGAEPIVLTLQEGATGTVPTVTREGYTFDGWYTDRQCTQRSLLTVGGVVQSDNVTFYARWVAIDAASDGSAATSTDSGTSDGSGSDSASSGDGSDAGTGTVTDSTSTVSNNTGDANHGSGDTTDDTGTDGDSGTDSDAAPTGDTTSDEPTSTGDDIEEQPTPTHLIYFTNNQSWAVVNVYAFNDAASANAVWPGTPMTYVDVNEYGESVFSADVYGYTKIIFNNGQDGNANQTVDIDLSAAGSDNAYYLSAPSADGKWSVGKWQYVLTDSTEPIAPVERTLSCITAKVLHTLPVGATLGASDFYVLATYNDGSVEAVTDFTVAEGYANSQAGKTTVSVHYLTQSTDVEVEFVNSDKIIYFTADQGWANVNVYAFNDAAANADWPGIPMTYVGVNGFGQSLYRYDATGYTQIVFNNGQGGNANQTVDIDLSAAGSANAYYLSAPSADGKWSVGTWYFDGKLNGQVVTHVFEGLDPAWAVGGKKMVYIYTPAGYTADRRYKVLYMFDGQNLFDPAENSWGVNTTLTELGADCIVVGIDNADGARDKQLTMSEQFGQLSSLTTIGGDVTANYKNGKLDELGDFIRDVLMPYIAANYSIVEGRENTLIAGSSSGGLAAFYLGLRDSDIYGTVGAFSPATGLFDLSAWQEYLRKESLTSPQTMFIYCGYGNEGADEVEQLENYLYTYQSTAGAITLKGLLEGVGYAAEGVIATSFVKGAIHNESAWRQAFKTFMLIAY